MKLPLNVNLTGKVAVVTGAGGVLMGEFAKALALCGAKVALVNRSDDKIKLLAEEIGENALAVKADCTDKQSIIEAKKVINERFGKTDILINGVGGNSPKATTDSETMPDTKDIRSFFDLDENGLKFVLDINILSAFLVTQVFAEDMIGRGGNIINISSMNAYLPLTKIPAYSAAKAGISNFTQWLAVYFAPSGIRCNAIAPGFFSTKQNEKLLYNDDGTLTERSHKIINGTPLKRFGKPEELIGTLLWLACDEASGFVTGSIIAVDGGFSAYGGV